MNNYQKLAFVFFSFVFVNPTFGQICRDQIPESTPTEQFEVHDDGTVSDTKTGLMWQRCNVGQNWDGNTCSGFGGWFSVHEIFNVAKQSETAGYDDWRLPNFKELFSIVETSCRQPAINAVIFPNTSSNLHWTSTPSIETTGQFHQVFFQDGQTGDFWTSSSRVRLVRDVQD